MASIPPLPDLGSSVPNAEISDTPQAMCDACGSSLGCIVRSDGKLQIWPCQTCIDRCINEALKVSHE